MPLEPVVLDTTVEAVELEKLDTVGRFLEWNDPNTRITRGGNTRITRGGNTRITRGYNSTTVYPFIEVVVLPSVIEVLEVE